MSKIIKTVRTAGIAFGGERDVLVTGGIGSCVVVCLWASKAKLGAMAHIMLPTSDSVDSEDLGRLGISPDLAVPHLLAHLRRKVENAPITAKLVGGGNVLGSADDGGIMSETPKNIIRNTKHILAKEMIYVASECLGGGHGRRVEFNVETGEVLVENVLGESKRI